MSRRTKRRVSVPVGDVGDAEEARHLAVCLVAGGGGHALHVLRLTDADLERLSVQRKEPEVLSIAIAEAQWRLTEEHTG